MTSKYIIIGAPRSGTNMLRDLLCKFDGVTTWPCDEINYIWRHGNVKYPSDEIPPDLASNKICHYINRQFNHIAKTYNSDVVIEKTCANSLRVPFVNKVLPDAKYIFIYRNGLDVVGSAKLRWTADLDLSYLFKKIRFVPIFDIPYYAFRYIKSRFHRFFSSEKRLSFWGPVLPNMQPILKSHSLNEICAIQWQQCIEASESALKVMPEERVFRVCYEKFVSNPFDETKRLLSFVNIKATDDQVKQRVASISNRSVGKGLSSLDESEVSNLMKLIGDTLEYYEYK